MNVLVLQACMDQEQKVQAGLLHELQAGNVRDDAKEKKKGER